MGEIGKVMFLIARRHLDRSVNDAKVRRQSGWKGYKYRAASARDDDNIIHSSNVCII